MQDENFHLFFYIVIIIGLRGIYLREGKALLYRFLTASNNFIRYYIKTSSDCVTIKQPRKWHQILFEHKTQQVIHLKWT